MKLICLNLAIKIDNSQKVINFLKQQNADIVCLQEVADHREESVVDTFRSKQDLDLRLNRLYPYRYFAPLWQASGFTKVDFGGYIDQGNYILSKFQITNVKSLFFHKSYEKVDDWVNVKFHNEDHARALQVAEVMIENKAIRIMNIHGIWTENKLGDKRTISQNKFILEEFKKSNLPTILVGDFNLSPESYSIKILDKVFRNITVENGIISTRPDFKDNLDSGNNVVDYAFIDNKIKCKSFKVLPQKISDHYPLILEFDI